MRWLSLVLAVFVCAGCQTHYVSPSGNDSNPGTREQPWRHIEASLQKLSPGSVLVVEDGTYEEQIGPTAVPKGTADQRILVTAAEGAHPVIRGYLQLLEPDHWILNGIDVEYGPLSGGNQLVRISGGTGWQFRNAEVSGAHSTAGLLIDDGSSNNRPLGSFSVSGNCIHDTVPTNNINQDHNVYVNDFNGSPDADGVIERNLLFNAPNGRNVKLGPGSPPEGGAHHVVVRYNTAYNAAQNLSTSVGTHDVLFERNIVRRAREANFWAFEMPASQNNVARDNVVGEANSVFAGTSGSALIQDGGGNVDIDPQFDSLGCQGFHPANEEAAGYGRYAP